MGELADWDIKAFLMPHLHPLLVAGSSARSEDVAAFKRDQKAGMGVSVAIDVDRILFHTLFKEVPGGDDSMDLLENDIAIIPLKRELNISASVAWKNFGVEFPPQPMAESTHLRSLGLGDLGPASSRALIRKERSSKRGNPQICFNGKSGSFPCRVQSTPFAVLTYSECVRRCVAWFVESTGSSPKERLKRALAEAGGAVCHRRLRGVQEGRLLCAHNPGAGALSGDSGGPLFLEDDGVSHHPRSRKVVGVLSWTDVQASRADIAKMPVLYESTSFHHQAIDAALDCLFAPHSQNRGCRFGPASVGEALPPPAIV